MTWRVHVCDLTHFWGTNIYVCVMSLRYMYEPCASPIKMMHTYTCIEKNDAYIYVEKIVENELIRKCTHRYKDDAFIWRIRDAYMYVCRGTACQCCHVLKWLIYVCDMTDWRVWHDIFIRVTGLIHVCDMTHACVWHDLFISMTGLIHVCDVTHSYV